MPPDDHRRCADRPVAHLQSRPKQPSNRAILGDVAGVDDVDGLHGASVECRAGRGDHKHAVPPADHPIEPGGDRCERGTIGVVGALRTEGCVGVEGEQVDQQGQVGARRGLLGTTAVRLDESIESLRLPGDHPSQVFDSLRDLCDGRGLGACIGFGIGAHAIHGRTCVGGGDCLRWIISSGGTASSPLLRSPIVGVYGIDLGTTNSAIATIDADGRPEVVIGLGGVPTTPSVVLLPSANDHMVGEGARRQARLDPDNVCALVKRRMGDADWRFVAHGQSWSAPAISALILKSLASDAAFAGEKVERAVITVPAYFGDEERRATVQAGTYAGLDVVGVLSEPIAAALSYGFRRLTDTSAASGSTDETVLVYDLGGGTFDATVIELADRRISVLAVEGDHQLGGTDWDERLALHLSRRFCEEHPDAEDPLDDSAGSQALILAAERAKHELTDAESTTVIIAHDGARSVIAVSRADLEELTAGLLNRTLDLTRACVAAARDRGVTRLSRILLVGGSSRMPAVAREVGAALGITPELTDPDLAVARGAAVYGEKLEIERLVAADLRTRGRLSDGAPLFTADPGDVDGACARVAAAFGLPVSGVRRMLEITVDTVVSRGFGVLAVGRSGETEATWLVHRNQTLPIRVRRSFGTMRMNQDRIELVVVEQQGQALSPHPEDAKVLIEGSITDIPFGYDEGSEVQVTFEMGFDGVLHVTAFHVEAQIPLTMSARTGATLSQAEVARELDQVHRTRRRDV